MSDQTDHLEELCRLYRAAFHAADAAEEHIESARMALRSYHGEALPKYAAEHIRDLHARAVDAAQELRETLESLSETARTTIRSLPAKPEPRRIHPVGTRGGQ